MKDFAKIRPGAFPALQRKSEHVRIVLEADVQHGEGTLLDEVRLAHDALCDLAFNEIKLSTGFFGKTLKAPLLITSMTGGAELSGRINADLARIAAKQGIAFSVGSQRIMLRHPETSADFQVRRHIPDGVLIGNIGATLLREYPLESVARLAEDIEADGLCVHLNPAQELIQHDGDRDFRGTLDNIARLVERLHGRVIVKETGAGLSPVVLERLASVGVRYVDVSGAGGTSWTKVESYRAATPVLKQASITFGDWGIPTAVSLIAARRVLPAEAVIIGAGGIKTGLDSARAIAIGADLTGFARPILRAYVAGGIDGAEEYVESHIYELKMSMMLTGAADLSALRKVPRAFTGALAQWVSGLGLDHEDVNEIKK